MMDDYYIEEAMINFGGDFVRRLGMLHRVGDPDNRARIKAAFPEYWEKYRLMAKMKEKQR